MNIVKTIQSIIADRGFFAGSKYIAKTCTIKVIRLIEQKLPIKEWMVFECESDMDDNPRALYEYLLSIGWNKDHKLIWIVRDVDGCKRLYSEQNVVFISRYDGSFFNQIRLNYYLSVAKWFVFSHPYWFKKKRKTQFVLNTWHGVGMKRGTQGKSKISDSFDYVLVPSLFSRDMLSQEWPVEKVKIMDYPRLDFLFTGEKETLGKLFFQTYKAGERIVLCMPTYRQGKNWTDSDRVDRFAIGVITSEEELIKLNESLKRLHTYLIVKIHPLQDMSFISEKKTSNIRYITNRELFEKKAILYELLGVCDALITDVSSVYTDFLLLNKPVAFFLDNFTDYERGYNVENPFDYMPGKLIGNYSELVSFFSSIQEVDESYATWRERIFDLIHSNKKNDNCERLYNWLILEN